jgi:restriction endonuclease
MGTSRIDKTPEVPVGKTRLMGAFISYLHLAHGINNFLVLAPNLAIYNKLISDFKPNTRKFVFQRHCRIRNRRA